ncbi:hypothetical protein EJ06DRAFT_116169 [Trichodelitschia bisporula]|uniref:Uncharacterized protein n=1 Tax=Trichodelitschia bisporula TaxID=703511 RepID=A0A6G1HQ37_9PEZI|nr:hypothetical protein EJ06DRAFT_116169 [Trichodelitschia bisporula]
MEGQMLPLSSDWDMVLRHSSVLDLPSMVDSQETMKSRSLRRSRLKIAPMALDGRMRGRHRAYVLPISLALQPRCAGSCMITDGDLKKLAGVSASCCPCIAVTPGYLPSDGPAEREETKPYSKTGRNHGQGRKKQTWQGLTVDMSTISTMEQKS